MAMFPHGLMFHHFHNDHHPMGQGAISAEQLGRILDCYEGRIVPADEWLSRASAGTLGDDAVCLTFDDALKCQIDVAMPVLARRGLTAFWFVYSSVFQGNVEPLEVFRYFRTTEFENFDQFCDAFMGIAKELYLDPAGIAVSRNEVETYLPEFPFYSGNDRLFRFVRDRVLTVDQYEETMMVLMADRKFNLQAARGKLWMTDFDLTMLGSTGHIVGLHSYSHPLRIGRLDRDKQADEYRQNAVHVECVTGRKPLAMSHPCNSYNADTLSILRNIGVQVGFCSNMAKGPAASHLEFPREDHANIMRGLS